MTDSNEITVETVYADRRTGSPALRTAPSAASQVGAALLALLAVGGWWLGLLLGAYVFEVFDFRLGRIAGLGAAGGGVLVALLNVPLTKRLPTAASVVIALAGGLLFTSIAVPLVPPGYYAMRAELHRLDPPEWKVLDESRGGNSICFDVCTSITRMLQPAANEVQDADQVMTRILKRRGYQQVGRSYSGARVFRKGDLKITSYDDQGFPASPGYAGRPPGWTLRIEAA